ncbi:MAG: geranylgeranyl reductase family protein [Rubrivivax sp.]|nr:geranylgeranyl reductase family protein [Rubrivivax sp.]
MPEPAMPLQCDVAVIGAGPAGSAAAWQLARRGLDVVLADQHVFPRDKVCGDGLIPDAHAALRRIGVLDEVMAHARRVQQVRCTGPRGGQVDVPGTLAVLPRLQLDPILVRAAARAGARLLMPARFEAPVLEGDRVTGVRLRMGEATHELAARWVVLATGAVPQGLMAAGMCERRTPSGVALRGYVKNEAMAGRITALEIFWHRRLAGGYGWIFPAPGGIFNIGTGLTGSHAVERADGGLRMQDVNLRTMFDAFCEVYAPAGELMRGGTLQGELKGAPLRCSLGGARWSRPGLLVTGEAAGSTYAFTGEGIGKALETGLLAAEAIDPAQPDEAVRQRYEASLRALLPRFGLYEKAAHVNHRPWLTDLVIWRARRSPRILRRMSGVLEETQNPGRLLSWRGITRLMFE